MCVGIAASHIYLGGGSGQYPVHAGEAAFFRTMVQRVALRAGAWIETGGRVTT